MQKNEMMDKIIQYQMRLISTSQVSKFLDEYTEALSKPHVIDSVCRCKKCNCEIKNDVGDGLCAECWSAN